MPWHFNMSLTSWNHTHSLGCYGPHPWDFSNLISSTKPSTSSFLAEHPWVFWKALYKLKLLLMDFCRRYYYFPFYCDEWQIKSHFKMLEVLMDNIYSSQWVSKQLWLPMNCRALAHLLLFHMLHHSQSQHILDVKLEFKRHISKCTVFTFQHCCWCRYILNI